jgi:hypothetical protein
VRDQRPQGLVIAGKVLHDIEHQDVLWELGTRGREAHRPCSSFSGSSLPRTSHPARVCEARRRVGGSEYGRSRETESRGQARSRAWWHLESARCPGDTGHDDAIATPPHRVASTDWSVGEDVAVESVAAEHEENLVLH